MDNKDFKATVDGKEVQVELIDEEKICREEKINGRFLRGKSLLPFIAAGAAIVVVLLLSITLFIWALPVLLPIIIVIFLLRKFAGSGRR